MFKEIREHAIQYIYSTVRDEFKPQKSKYDDIWELEEDRVYDSVANKFGSDLHKHIESYELQREYAIGMIIGYIEAVLDSIDIDQTVKDAHAHYNL